MLVHDYGGVVGQELLDRDLAGKLFPAVTSLTVLNCGIVASAYRPTRLQKLLATPIIGRLVARAITAGTLHTGLDAVRGSSKLADADFGELWQGISLSNGHLLAHLHIRYNAE
ncbi:hypothetical protein BKG77_05680 [Mycobacteroides chelonae]|uniref:hypothetical protein n=1 Tax=Mycobacteroides chelonae TaxID=1774 RepID=UPI0008A92034|nr:hypothetical protein [Mycobacteroides chelonae]OHU23181.1 hypothetical protein BKG77_05680 [Mycobacteroides chelonae]